jgi:hypothetical protein
MDIILPFSAYLEIIFLYLPLLIHTRLYPMEIASTLRLQGLTRFSTSVNVNDDASLLRFISLELNLPKHTLLTFYLFTVFTTYSCVMPRPRPRQLTNMAPGHYDPDQQLTPRTPHSGSRTSRAEQGFAKLQIVEANDAEDDGSDTFQSAPLLVSSSSARFSRRNTQQPPTSAKINGHKILNRSVAILSTAISRLPLVAGILTAGILLLLTVLSFTRREALHKYVGAKAPNITVSTSGSKVGQEHGVHLLSYENYTTFPLYPLQYLAECKKLNTGYMRHGDYWDISVTGVIDTAHHDPSATGGNSRVCSSSITYMLDGTVGLTADLALMAQAAALAREVGFQSSIFSPS